MHFELHCCYEKEKIINSACVRMEQTEGGIITGTNYVFLHLYDDQRNHVVNYHKTHVHCTYCSIMNYTFANTVSSFFKFRKILFAFNISPWSSFLLDANSTDLQALICCRFLQVYNFTRVIFCNHFSRGGKIYYGYIRGVLNYIYHNRLHM